MILDDLYIALRDRLKDPARPDLGIATIDWFKDQPMQMEMQENPRQDPLSLPAVLIRYERPEWKPRGRKHYEAEGIIYLDVVQLIVDDPLTSDRDPDLVTSTRATYDFVHEIAKRPIGMRGVGYGTVGLIGYDQDHTFTKIRVDTIALRSLLCTDMDPNTYVHRDTPTLVIDGQPMDPPPSLGDVTVRNTDDSYYEVVEAPGSLTLPNITHRNSDGTPVELPAMVPFEADLCPVPLPAVVINSDATYEEEFDAPGPLLLPDVTHTDSDGSPVVLPGMTPFVADVCGPGTLILLDGDDDEILTREIPSGTTATVYAPNAFAAVKNSNNVQVAGGSIPSGKSRTFDIADSQVQLRDTASNDLGAPVAVAAGDNAVVIAPDAQIQRKDSAGTNIGTLLQALSGAITNVPSPDGVALLQDSAGGPLGLTSVKSNGSAIVTAPDGNVQVRDSAGLAINSPVAVKSGGTANATAPDATIQRIDSAGANIGSPGPAKSNATVNVTCPDGTVQNKATSPTWSALVKSNGTFILSQVRFTDRYGVTTDVDYLPSPIVLRTEPAITADVLREYIASALWTHPAGLKGVWLFVGGAGGGGGCGRRSDAGAARAWGCNGEGGAGVWMWIPASDLGAIGSTLAVTIGAGGAGGAASSGTGSVNGNGGTAGGDSSFGTLVIAKGGGAGAGGSSTNGANTARAGGAAGSCTPGYNPHAISGQARVGNFTTAAAGTDGSHGMNTLYAGASGGCGGGGGFNGGNGGGCYHLGSLTAGPTGGAGSANATNGADDVALKLLFSTLSTKGPGTGGAGSAGVAAGSSGSGGNGGRMAGGGGSGVGFSGSGKGGDGGGGLVLLVEIFN